MPLTITKPQNGAIFAVGDPVEFVGVCEGQTKEIRLTADGQFPLTTVTIKGTNWTMAHRFSSLGRRKIKADALAQNGKSVGNADVEIVIALQDYGLLVPIPKGINKGVSKAQHATMKSIFGAPGALTNDCSHPTNSKILNLLVTQDVGPFKVTGIKPAVEAVRRAFAEAQKDHPELLKVLTSAGMLCCRRIRTLPGKPPSKQFSNHSWGTALDIKVKGALDPRGDGKTQVGLLLLAPYFNAERFFWGAGFKGDFEDAMHFEASNELVKDWKAKGIV